MGKAMRRAVAIAALGVALVLPAAAGGGGGVGLGWRWTWVMRVWDWVVGEKSGPGILTDGLSSPESIFPQDGPDAWSDG